MLPTEVQAHPSREVATVPPPTTTAALELSAYRAKKLCKQYNSGWANRGFECPRLREGVECPYYHDPARREVAVAKKKKDREERILAQRQRVQSLPLNQVGKASKKAEDSNVASQQSSVTPNIISPNPPHPKKFTPKCWQYAKFGQCKRPDCVYRHAGPPNPQEPKGENVEGADAKLSLATSSKVAPPSNGVSRSAEPVQNKLKAVSPQLPNCTPPPKSQNTLNPIPPQAPIGTPPPQLKSGQKNMISQAPSGTPPPQVNSSQQKSGSDTILKQSLAVDTAVVVAEQKASDSESPIAYKSIQSLVAGSEPLDKARKRGRKSSEICRMYKKSGQCKYNKRCHRSHEVIPDSISAKDQSEQPSIQLARELTSPSQNDVNPPTPLVTGISDVHGKHNQQFAVQSPQNDDAIPAHNNFQVSTQNPVGTPSVPHRQSTHITKRFCYAFANSGRCKLGDKCPYSHVEQQNSLKKEQVNRLMARLSEKQPTISSSQGIREEFSQALSNNITRGSQDFRLEFPQRPNKSFVRGSQDISEEFAQKSENTIIRSSQDIRKEASQTPSKSFVGGSQDFKREFCQTSDTAFMRGSQNIREGNLASIDTTSVSVEDTEKEPSENTKPQSLSQVFINRGLPQTAGSSFSRQKVKGVCDFYSRTGWCQHEGACKFSHALPSQKSHESKENGVGQVSSLPLTEKSNFRSTEATKEHAESSLGQLDGTSTFKGKTSQRSLGPQRPRKEPQQEKKEVATKTHTLTDDNDPSPENEKLSSNLPVRSKPSASKHKRRPKKKNNPWKDDPSEQKRPTLTWTYSEAAKPLSVEKTPIKFDTSSYFEVAKFPSQKCSPVERNSGPSPFREKRFEVPKVLCKQGCQPIEALPYDPRARVTDLGHGSWDTDYTLISWLKNNLRTEKLAETFSRYRYYLERGVIPLIALEPRRDLKPHVNLASFSLLPNEIKEMIWKYALINKRDVRVRLDTREVEVEKDGNKKNEIRNRIVAHTLTAPLLRTCQLSRRVALAHYKLAFGTKTGGEARIHMDFKLDRFFILHPDPNQLIDISKSLYSKDLSRVRNLGIPILHWIQGDNDRFFNAIAQFRNLRELSLVVGDGVKDQTYWKGRRICPFIARKLQEVWKERYPGVRSPGVFYQVIDAVQAKHWGIDDIIFSGLVCGETDYLSRWKNRLKRE